MPQVNYAVLHLKSGEKVQLSNEVSLQIAQAIFVNELTGEKGFITDGRFSYPVKEIEKVEWITP
ncbi:hypothetical protein MOF14_13195 [Bacillus spizizenii]|uniref:hypothetical protein n=1 Tax=Bacillus subtilis TaxID=1423 RepID=UPI00228045CE|nr:hypothetical protein [Bacillus spizizenii]